MIPYHVNNHVNYAFIDPIWCHLGSMAVWSLRIVCTTSAYLDAKRLHCFEQFNAFLDMFYGIKSFFSHILVTVRYDNLLLGSASVWYGKLLCAQCHTGTRPATSPRYDTLHMVIYPKYPKTNRVGSHILRFFFFKSEAGMKSYSLFEYA